MWFKVTINKDGSVASCENVGAALENGKTVRYVEADSSEAALKIVAAWQRDREQRHVRERAKYQQMKASGLCLHCLKVPRVPDRVHCAACLEWHRAYARDRYHGRIDTGLRPEAERAKAFGEARDRKLKKMRERPGGNYGFARAVTRRELLAEVLKNYDLLPPEEFRVWLSSELSRAIEERPPAKVAAWRQKVAAAE
jgi:hypothetical protein